MSKPFDVVVEEADLTNAALSRELGVGTTTLWRASTGQPISAKNAKKLCDRLPELNYFDLTLGRSCDEQDPDVHLKTEGAEVHS